MTHLDGRFRWTTPRPLAVGAALWVALGGFVAAGGAQAQGEPGAAPSAESSTSEAGAPDAAAEEPGAAPDAAPPAEEDPAKGPSEAGEGTPAGGGAPKDAPPEQKGPGDKPLVEAAVDTTIDTFREPVDRLSEHYLGSTSRPVRFDWRRSVIIVGAQGGELIERNNFGSFRVGGTVRRAFLSLMVEGQVSYVHVIGTESSRLLGLTPYTQASRPSRIELDVNFSYPLFEGVMTPLFDFIPPSQLVFSATAGGRYLFYPQVVIGDRNWRRTQTWTDQATWREIGTSLATVRLLDDDVILLEEGALPGMRIDTATMHTLVGFTVDAYYQPGVFFSGRAMLNIPALALVSGSRLGFWWELSLAMGWAF